MAPTSSRGLSSPACMNEHPPVVGSIKNSVNASGEPLSHARPRPCALQRTPARITTEHTKNMEPSPARLSRRTSSSQDAIDNAKGLFLCLNRLLRRTSYSHTHLQTTKLQRGRLNRLLRRTSSSQDTERPTQSAFERLNRLLRRTSSSPWRWPWSLSTVRPS